jgi:hypothetical protein
VVQDEAAFQNAYPRVNPTIIAGEFAGSLSNAGERIKLEDATGSTILEFEYSDEWYVATDGGGPSLVVRDIAGPYDDQNTWRASVSPGGSPGSANSSGPLAGDANGDSRFDQSDVVAVLQAGQYLSGQPATWSEGDWNGDGTFDQLDIVAALQTGSYQPAALAADLIFRQW